MIATAETAQTRMRIGALLWVCCFQFFIAEQVARSRFLGPYSMARNMISDLGALGCGARCSPWHALMNASFALQGVLIVSGALLLWRAWPASLLLRTSLATLALSGLGVLCVGLAPEDAPGAAWHVLGAAVHFVCGGLGMLLFGVARRRADAGGGLSVAAGLLALSATGALVLGITAGAGTLGAAAGLVERAAAYPLPVWLTVSGVALLLSRR